MVVMISGGSGLVGSALTARWKQAGHELYHLKRGISSTHRFQVSWDMATGRMTWPTSTPPKIDLFVHLAGAGIADHRWTTEYKKEIRSSRVEATQRLVNCLIQDGPLPRRFIGASAVGLYGNRGDELLTEDSAAGTGFLADTARDWEAAAAPLSSRGVSVSHVRFGVILSQNGGALAKQLPIFRLGLGGKLGPGNQWLSWISLGDTVRAIDFLSNHDSAVGPHNIVAPEPVTNTTFTRTLAETLHRPAFLPVPATILRLSLGEMADALLLGSQRAIPRRLLALGFQFQASDLATALNSLKLERNSDAL